MDSSAKPVPSTEGAAPDSGERFVPDSEASARIARIAEARARGWRLAAELLDAPTAEFCERMRSGALVADLDAAVSWLGPEAGRFMPVRVLFETFARRSRTRTAEQDLRALAEDHRRLWPRGIEWAGTLGGLAESAGAESAAWADGDHERAKALRMEQKEIIETRLLAVVPEWAVAADNSQTSMVYRVAARYLVSYLSFESGRDIEGVLRRGLPIG